MNKKKSTNSNKVSKTPKTTKYKKVTKQSKQKGPKQIVYPDGYVRPKVTASEMLSANDIKKRLKNFDKVSESDLDDLVNGDYVRYFEVLEDGKFKYKPGGFVLVNGFPTYLVLTNNGFNWSVQLDSNIIFKAKDIDKIQEEHDLEIDKLKMEKIELHTLLLKQKKIIKRLTKS